jgi:multisubunit Na+/H+ antiporter MnhB subunit
MRTLTNLAAPVDMSGGFSDFFKTIGMTGGGLVTKGIAAVIAIIAVRMLLQLSNDPKGALRKGSMAVGTLFVAVILALYGDTLFSTVTAPTQTPKG